MMVVGSEVTLDLTAEAEEPRQVLKRARKDVLNADVQEFTLVSHLDVPFLVKDLTDILRHTSGLQFLSLFSIALSGTAKHFHDLAKVIRDHPGQLKEVHMVDCGMYGNWKLPVLPGQESSVSSAGTGGTNSIHSKGNSVHSHHTMGSKGTKFTAFSDMTMKSASACGTTGAVSKGSRTAAAAAAATTTTTNKRKSPTRNEHSPNNGMMLPPRRQPASAGNSVSSGQKKTTFVQQQEQMKMDQSQSSMQPMDASMKSASSGATGSTSKQSHAMDSKQMMTMCKTACPTLDVLLEALAGIKTLENVELYGVPNANFDLGDDADQESNHRPVLAENEGKDDIAMVPMHADDSTTHSDNDFLDDYDEDIRGIPGCRRNKNTNRKLTLLMSPQAIGGLCRAPALNNLGLEDLNLGDDHIEAMMLALSQPGNSLKELKIWGCNISDRGARAIASMLLVNQTLTRLDLANNHIYDAGCVAIAKALHSNTTLQSLNLMGNECALNYDAISEGGCYEALMDMMKHNKTLTDLVLEPYEQDDEDEVPEFIFIPTTIGAEADGDASDDLSVVSDSP